MKRKTFLKLLGYGISAPYIPVPANFLRSQPPDHPRYVLPIIPYPLSLDRLPGFFRFDRSTVIHSDERAQDIADNFAETLAVLIGLRPAMGASETNSIRLELIDEGNGPEGYSLLVTTDSVLVRAAAPAGLFYGLQTVRQLLHKATIPCMRVADRPRFTWRGFMLDEARSFYGKEYVMKTIDLLSRYKFNVFHWHLTDDQGWRIQIRQYPKLTEVGGFSTYPDTNERYGGFYSQDDIREIVAYAARRHITVVPEIDVPGHSHAAMAAYPEFSCTGGPFEVSHSWRGFLDVLCPGKDESIVFVQNILSEVMEFFPSTYIHTGGDECPRTRWADCPHCKERIRKEGLSNVSRLQSWFSGRISEFLKQNGRKMIGWEEVGDGGLPDGVTLEIWMQEKALIDYARKGVSVVNALDISGTHDGGSRSAGYAKALQFDPVPASLSPSDSLRILGMESHLWTEGLRRTQDADWSLWPDPCLISELSWSSRKKTPYREFSDRLAFHVESLHAEGLRFPYASGKNIGGWTPDSIKRTFSELSWGPIASIITEPGTYEVQFVYTRGAHGIDIEWAALECEGMSPVKDIHNGFSGGNPRDSVYVFRVDSLPVFGAFRLRASIRGNGGTDSNGSVYVTRKALRPEP